MFRKYQTGSVVIKPYVGIGMVWEWEGERLSNADPPQVLALNHWSRQDPGVR